MNKSVAILVVLLVLQCGVNGIAMAQAQSNPCSKTSDIAFAGPHPIGGDCVGWGIPTGLGRFVHSPRVLLLHSTRQVRVQLRESSFPRNRQHLHRSDRSENSWSVERVEPCEEVEQPMAANFDGGRKLVYLDEIGVRPTRSESLPMVTATCYTLMVDGDLWAFVVGGPGWVVVAPGMRARL